MGLKSELKATLLIPVVVLGIAWLQEGIDQLLFGGQWNLPMVPGGSALGILTAPFSHGGWGHLLANSTLFLPLSWMVCFKSKRDYLAIWLGVFITAIPVWLWWPNGSHGLSGVACSKGIPRLRSMRMARPDQGQPSATASRTRG